MSDYSDQDFKRKFSVGDILYTVAPALILFLVYYILSILEIWAYLPPYIQFTAYLAVIVFGVLSCLPMMRSRFGVSEKKIRTYLTVFSGAALALTVLKFTEIARLTTLALMPAAVFTHQNAEVTANVTPPLYLKADSQYEVLQSLTGNELGQIHEGSVLDVRVSGLKWRPYLELSDGKIAEFRADEDGGYKASVEIGQQESWSIKQGAYEVGKWSLETIEDEHPKILQFAADENFENDKEYLALNIGVEDDHKIMRATLKVVSPDGFEEQARVLSLREVKSYENTFYLDLTNSDYAGSEAGLKLSVEDEAGQVSTAMINNIDIPVKDYRNPLAGKLMALHESLRNGQQVDRSLERQIQSLGLLSDDEMLPPVYYLALRSAYWRLVKPTVPEDREIATNLLWDLAQKMEDGELRTTESSLVYALEELSLGIKQKRSVTDVRTLLSHIDQLFRTYRRLSRLSNSEHYTLEIDLQALQKLYSHILTFTDQEKYVSAAQIVDVMRKGLIQNDDLILSKDGLGNYFALSEGREILNNLISIQKTLLASSYNDQLRGTLIEGSNIKMPPASKTEEDRNKEIMLQSRVGQAVKRLGKKLSFADGYSVMLIDNAALLVEDILESMKQSETGEVAKSQSELLAVMSNLKRILDKPISGASELEDIIEAITAQPVS